MKKVKKAGCILINEKEHTIALVYRKQKDDYTFPKGHLEDGETLLECAIRETAEETKRVAKLLEENPIYIDKYITPAGEDVELYYYLARDGGKSDNPSLDTHPTVWIPFDCVYDKVSYPSLKVMWNNIKDKVWTYMNR